MGSLGGQARFASRTGRKRSAWLAPVGVALALLSVATLQAQLRTDGPGGRVALVSSKKAAAPNASSTGAVSTTAVTVAPATVTSIAAATVAPTSTASSTSSATATSTATPARATPTQFGIGVQADMGTLKGWMPSTGAAWDYAYRYIGGGINRGGTTNWTEWEPNGTYPITFAAASSARGYTPVFSHYSLLAAVGSCDASCSESKKDLTNLNTPSVMSLYYADFAKLMQRLGTGTWDGVKGYGKDSIVHVEPDLSGYAQTAVLRGTSCYGFCTGVGNNPSLLRASVSSSGNADVVGLPDTYVGFNQALLRLRDRYAPNVRLAFHLSNWSTLYDLNSATNPLLDAPLLGARAGQFAALSGVQPVAGSASTYDLVFNDVSNKDAGYYTHVLLQPRFWDRDNVVFPNFHRWEAYVKAATVVTKRPVIVWQIPMGNQYFRTMDNSPNHYQDNRVEYLFSHIDELQSSGIVGLLFGKTTPTATHPSDAAGDGVTNPAPMCTRDGSSSGEICNDHASVYPDDDGGYLRIVAKQYSDAPVAVTPLPS